MKRRSPYASGVLTRSITATLSHDLMRNLNITFTATFSPTTTRVRTPPLSSCCGGFRRKLERPRTWRQRAVRLEYKLTRSITLRGSFTHEQLSSSFRNAGYSANVYLLGLRFQL